VSELIPAVVEWNRGVLAPLADRPLADPRVQVVERDVLEVLRANRTGFDAVLLDIDNGPSALTSHRNGALYAERGIAAARAALKPAGILAVWSSFADQQFARRLRNGGFDVVMERVRGRPRRGPNHVIYLAQRSDALRANAESPPGVTTDPPVGSSGATPATGRADAPGVRPQRSRQAQRHTR